MSKNIKYLIGIDEVGRGPLAGPVTVGIFIVSSTFKLDFCPPAGRAGFHKNDKLKVRDSKKLSEKEREDWFRYFRDIKRDPRKSGDDESEREDDESGSGNDGDFVNFVTTSLSAKKIDEKGINWCIKKAISKGLIRAKIKPEECEIRLDGLLHAPEKFKNQKTIIKGDEKENIIAAASIVAKVTRDRYMKRLAKKFPEYGFDIHKGYGTEFHRKAIKKYGLSGHHRKSYCKKLKD